MMSFPARPQHISSNAMLIRVLDAQTKAYFPEFLHKITAEAPTVTTNDIEVIDLNTLCLAHPTETCLYQAGGTSMVDAGIDDGDYMLVDRHIEPRSGHLVAADYFGESLIKEMVIDDDGITLVAHSPDHSDLQIEHPEYLTVIGVVTWVFADKRGWRG